MPPPFPLQSLISKGQWHKLLPAAIFEEIAFAVGFIDSLKIGASFNGCFPYARRKMVKIRSHNLQKIAASRIVANCFWIQLQISRINACPVHRVTNAYGSVFGAVGSWLDCGEAGEVEASAERGCFQVGSQVGRLAR